MRKMFPLLLMLLSQATWGQRPAALIYTANRQGEVEPCGCQINQIGGLNRMAEYLKNIRKENDVLLVDSGDSFFSSPKVSTQRAPQELLRAKLIAESYREMGLNYIIPGDRDLALGAKTFCDLAAKSGAKIVSANLKFKEAETTIHSFDVWERDGIRVFVTGVVSDVMSKFEGVLVEPVEESIEKVLAVARSYQPDYILVLSHLGQAEDQKLAQKHESVFVLGAHSMDSLSEPIKMEKSYVFQPGIEGQQIGEFPLVKGGGLRAHALRDLGKNLDKANSVKQLMNKYYKSLEKLPTHQKENNNLEKQWVGNPQLCKNCHEEQYQFWKGTKHSTAILALYAKKRHHDPQCIGCHTLGYESSGGFSSLGDAIQTEKKSTKTKKNLVEHLLETTFGPDKGEDLDSRLDPRRYQKLHDSYWSNLNKLEKMNALKKNFLGVQCEHCHDNRQEHITRGSRVADGVRIESCKFCHSPPNAKDFNPNTLSLVACPKMARTPAEKK